MTYHDFCHIIVEIEAKGLFDFRQIRATVHGQHLIFEKNKEYSVEEFLDNLHSNSSVALKNARTTLTLNLAMSNALRLLHDNKEIELKKYLDSEKTWHLFPNEEHEFTSDITHIIIKKAVK